MPVADLTLAPTSVVTPDQLALIKTTIAKDATDDELRLFLFDCKRQGVHPLDKLIFFTKRSGRYTPITSIDFMRLRAASSGEGAGIDDAVFNGAPKTANFAATVTVYRLVQGIKCAYTATARWSEYKPEQNDFMWMKMPHTMLSKCAEALALRKAFPQQLAGLYSKEEFDQADAEGEPKWVPEPISTEQRKRLFAIATSHGWGKTEMATALSERFGIEKTAEITKDQYPKIVAAFEQPPAPVAPPANDDPF